MKGSIIIKRLLDQISSSTLRMGLYLPKTFYLQPIILESGKLEKRRFQG